MSTRECHDPPCVCGHPVPAILGLLVAARILVPSGDFLSDDTWQIIGLILAFSGTMGLLFMGSKRARGQSIQLTVAAVSVGIGTALLLNVYFI